MKLQMAPNKVEIVPGKPAPKTFGEALEQALDHKREVAAGETEFGIRIGTKLWLGKKIGLKHSGVISHWAAGRHLPNDDSMRKLCAALDLDYSVIRRLPAGDLPSQAAAAKPEIVEKGGRVFMIKAGRTYLLDKNQSWREIEIES